MNVIGSETIAKSILVIDKCEDTANSLALLLRVVGCRARAVATCAAAITTARTDPPDVIVFEPWLLDVDARELIRRLSAAGTRSRFIALTTLCRPADLECWRDAGVQACLIKPATLESIMAAVSGKGD